MTPSTSLPEHWLTDLAKYGPWTALAVFLVWFGAQTLAADVRANTAQLNDVSQKLDEHMRDTQRMNVTLYGVCMILANGEKDKEPWCGVKP